MTANTRLLITCECGKTIQKRNYGQHCFSKHHMKFVSENKIDGAEVNQGNAVIFNLASYLRENDLRSNRSRVRAIVQRYAQTDPYTKRKFTLVDDESISEQFHIDHIHEAQILACAIRHTREFLPRNAYILSLLPLRRVLNDAPNLTITEAAINVSKGQAIRYFLGQYEKKTDMTLLGAFIQTASGKERSIAHFARNITALIEI